MGKTVYFDCFSGASGDMILGALLDLGLPLDDLRKALGSLAIDYGTVGAERVVRAGVSATKFRVEEPRARHEHASGATHGTDAGIGPPHVDRSGGHAGTQADDHHDHQEHPHGHHEHDHQDRSRHARPHQGSERHAREHHDCDHHHDHGPHGHGQDHDPDPHRADGQSGHAHHAPHAHAHSHADGHGHHSLADISHYIDRSALSREGKDRARSLFVRLAEAEAAIHAMPLERIHLHEVGAVDSIIDIVGAVFGMEWLGADRIMSSPINVGSGTVRCAHGVFPVPAPATARLLEGAPIYAAGVPAELTTPTGALLLTSYADGYGALPAMTVEKIGYGAGDRDFPGRPNVLRVFAGQSAASATVERIVTLECEIDDMNPQLFGPLMDRLYEAGALDVFYAAVQMKKGRPGTLVTIVAGPDSREALTAVLFRETTTIGVRYHEMHRERLAREIRSVDTPVGTVRVKVARRDGRVVNASPEFEDCARAAAAHRIPIKEVQALAMKAWLEAKG